MFCIKIRIAGKIYDSLANGPGMRYVLFTQGCTIHCDGCQNKHTWDLNSGQEVEIKDIIDDIFNDVLIDGITISGGDPIEQPQSLLELCKEIKNRDNNMNIMIYTGRTYEELVSLNNDCINNILKTADYLVDGRFEKDNTDNAIKYTGSANQRIIDLRQVIKDA